MYKLLIAEDIEIIRNMLNNSINWTSKGCELIGVARNGDDAIHVMERIVPDIIITDIRMPIMDGFQLIQEVRKKKADIECIILSAYEDFNYAKNAIKLGVIDYVLKPLDVDELFEALDKSIKRIKEREESSRQQKLVNDILRERYPNFNGEISELGIESNARNAKIAEKCIEFIKENIFLDISVETVANQMYLNPKYLSALFKEVTGESISKYITRSKLEKAAELLRDPFVKVYEVCEKIGYADQNYFRDLFSKYFGCTPSEYKKKSVL